MPEEVNRLLTDALADSRLVSEPSSGGTLRREGVSNAKIRLVGNVMIDTLLTHLPAARAQQATRRLGLDDRAYGLVTLHRPSTIPRRWLAVWISSMSCLNR